MEEFKIPEEKMKEPILEVRNITKHFPGVQALNDVSLKFYAGEVHAVVGENGAGKSTLMKILAGAYVPDSGEILLDGNRVAFTHPQEAHERGISIIYQEFNLLPDRTVAQNIYLGREPSKFGLVDSRLMNKMAEEVMHEIGIEGLIAPTAIAGTLSVAEQQLIEIAKAISLKSRILIMDEPTAALTINEVRLLDDLILRLKKRDMAIIFISHRLGEVFDIADKITVLKDGQLVGTVATQDVTTEKIVHMMVGRELDHYYPPLGSSEDIGEVIVKVENGSNQFLQNINFELRKGEVVGIAGLQGSGRTELAQALFGVAPFKSGKYTLKGKMVSFRTPNHAIKNRIGFVTEDRKTEGICPKQPIRDNMLLTVRSIQPMFTSISKDGIKKAPKLVPNLGKQTDVRTDSYDREVQYLSGGNQQKVILSKWLASDSDLFIFDEPTRGIDVEAKASIHDMIRGLTKQGKAVLMISSELPEVIGMSDRILVMWDGSIVGELPAKSSESEIMLMATGHNGKQKNTGESEA